MIVLDNRSKPNLELSRRLPGSTDDGSTSTRSQPHVPARLVAVDGLTAAGVYGSPNLTAASATVTETVFKSKFSQSLPNRVVALALFTVDCIDCSLPPAVQRRPLQSLRIIGGGALVQIRLNAGKLHFQFHSTGFSAAPHLETEAKVLNDMEDALTKFDVLTGYDLHGRLLPLLAAKSPTGERISIDELGTLPADRLCDLVQNRSEGLPLPFAMAAGRAGIPVMPADSARDLGQLMSFGHEQSITIFNHITATYRLWLDRHTELSGDVQERERALDQLFSRCDEIEKSGATPARLR